MCFDCRRGCMRGQTASTLQRRLHLESNLVCAVRIRLELTCTVSPIQCSTLVRQVSALSLALCVMKIAGTFCQCGLCRLEHLVFCATAALRATAAREPFSVLMITPSRHLLTLMYASTAPEGLEEAVGFQPFLTNKFGGHYMATEVDPFLDAVRECVAQEASAEVQSQRAEILRACILELRSRNRWKRSGEDK
jgi:hypothetical protein